jgi:hypothetical protein
MNDERDMVRNSRMNFILEILNNIFLDHKSEKEVKRITFVKYD